MNAMNAMKKLICLLAAGATVAAAAPAFADPGRGQERQRDYQSATRYYGNHGRYDDRGEHRGWERPRYVEMQRPAVVERPVYYAQPAPRRDLDIIGPAILIGAVIGSIMYSQR